MAEIPCLPLRQLTDGPLFSAGQGTLSSLVNMELQDGYAEARGGFEELKPSGGTANDPISSGGYSDVVQVSSSYGWIRTETPGNVFSANLQFDCGWMAFGVAPAANASIYFGADLPFSRVSIMLSNLVCPDANLTKTYEYYNGAAWTALTMAESASFATIALRHASWKLPTDWAANTVGDVATGRVLKYWMRIRITAVAAPTTVTIQWASGNWVGSKDLYFLTQDPRVSANGGTLKRRDQSGTAAEDFSIDASLFSGNASPARSATYRGRLFFVNGKEGKRWDGIDFVNIGLPAYAATTTIGAAGAGTGMGAGIWRHYVAWGYGPMQNEIVMDYRLDPQCLYGVGQATYSGTERTTTVGNEQVTVTITGTIPEDANAAYIYRTPDLTNVSAANRGDFPAFLIGVLWRYISGTNPATSLVGAGVFTDVWPAPMFPQTEAITYSNLPPNRMKYVAVYQNRLFLGDDNYWYWSDPFRPDSFNRYVNYVALAKATGGRHMGGLEFADQMVLFTEDQTWGLTNVDLDVPQLYPIALGVGCVAPDSAGVVDGVLIWLARDGFYSWDGSRSAPKKISSKMDNTFRFMSFTNHGGSKATGHNRRYDIRLSSPGFVTQGLAYRFSLDSGEWSLLTPAGMASTIYPLATIYAPLGNNDAGVLHPIWAKADYTTSGDFSLYLGELTTQDAGTNYTCSATMHFPVSPGGLFSPYRVKAYYQAANGWGTPTLSFVPSDVIGSSVGTLNTGPPDTGSDYSIIGATFSQVGRGSSNIDINFSVSSAAGGTINAQRLFGALVEGKAAGIRRGGV